jgi:hypothetical protein
VRRRVRASLPVVVAVATAIGALLAAGVPAAVAAAPAARWASSSAPASGSVGVRLVDVPVDEATNPRARQYIVDQLAPGTTIHRRIEVANKTAFPVRVAVYAAAASIADGSFTGGAGHDANDLSSWTTLGQGSLDVAAGGVALDTVTVAIPQDAAPAERYALIWAEVTSTGNGNITLINRAGIRMYVSVGGHNAPSAKFTVDTVTAQRDAQGRPVVQAQIHNTGGRALDMSGTLSLSKVTGALSAGPYQVQLGTTLAPGQSEPVRIILTDQVADGPWNATLALRSGLLHETYRAQITFPHHPGTAAAASTQPATTPNSGHRSLLTYALLTAAILAAAGSLIAALVIATRRRRTKTTPAHRRRGNRLPTGPQPDSQTT